MVELGEENSLLNFRLEAGGAGIVTPLIELLSQ
jgi:hypothetical protein